MKVDKVDEKHVQKNSVRGDKILMKTANGELLCPVQALSPLKMSCNEVENVMPNGYLEIKQESVQRGRRAKIK